ncbi:MFS transporter [Bacillus sp. FJAT-49736]|uniref:MFS transporter n=1 Tax=Bacillus sp. FJAT-49736 TaxID=2833582 RepID=UPI001BC9F3C9|nr:MFS transporter [Bacillus sp. FJAT-49736]MBS4172923.1 MFS transporter [Bacillus sp. FJAT-49736]
MSKPKLWTKDFLIVSLSNFFLYFTFYLLIATITVYATNNFNASPSVAGLVSGIFVIGTLIARLFAGKYIEQLGRKNLLYFGLIFVLITTLLYFIANSLTFLLIIRFINGAALGIASTATGTIVSSIIPNERRGEGTGYYALSTTLAAAFGPFLGMFISEHIGFNMNFTVCSVLLALSLVAAFFLKVPKIEISKEQLQQMKNFSLRNFFEAKAIPISIMSILVGLGYSSVLAFLTSFAQQIHLVDIASFFFIIYAIAILVSRPFTGRWFDTKGENIVMYPSFIALALGLFVLSQASAGYFIIIAGIFIGLGYGTFISSAQAIAIKVSPRHRMGLATSTFYMFMDAGIGIGPFILGCLVPSVGYRGVYEYMGVLLLICVFLYYILHGRKASNGNQGEAVVNK